MTTAHQFFIKLRAAAANSSSAKTLVLRTFYDARA